MKPQYKSIALLGTLAISNFAHAALNDTGIKTCSNAAENGLPCPISSPTTAPDKSKVTTALANIAVPFVVCD